MDTVDTTMIYVADKTKNTTKLRLEVMSQINTRSRV